MYFVLNNWDLVNCMSLFVEEEFCYVFVGGGFFWVDLVYRVLVILVVV